MIYPIIARLLSAELLGAWALISTAGFLVALSDLGLTTAVHRAAVTSDHDRARRAVAMALLSITLVAPVVAVLSYAFLLHIPNLPPEFLEEVRHAAAVVLVGGVIAAVAYPYRGFVIARGGITSIASARAASALIQLTVTGGVIWVERSLLAPAVGFVVGALVELFLTLRAARAIDPSVPTRPRLPDERRETLDALRDGAASLVISIAMVVAVRVDVFVMSRVTTLAGVAAYGVAGRAIDTSYLITKQATVALMPRLGDPARRAAALRIGVGSFVGVVAAGMLALAFFGQPLLVAWVGPVAESPITGHVLVLLGLAAILQSTSDVPGAMLTLGGRTAWASAIPIALGSAVNIGVSLLGAPHYGFWAVAGSSILGNGVTALLIWWSATRMLGWGPVSVLRTFAAPIACSAVATAIGLALSGYARHSLLPSIAACAAMMLLGCAALSIMLWRSARADDAPLPSPEP